MDVEVRVDKRLCIGSGQCVNIAPGVFAQDEQAKAYVHDQVGEPEEKIVHAVTACPMSAIAIFVDGARVGPDDLKDWDRGVRADDPLVEVLMGLSGEHEDLRTGFAEGARSGAVGEVRSLVTAHVAAEAAAYDSIAELIAPEMVTSFHDSLGEISSIVGDVVDGDAEALERLRVAVEVHIRLEETVLFPVALGSLWRRSRAR